ncbi:MAG: hypothetical protein CMM55_09070 [Rhodospirillaceae bacterium]|nr:hypothetical protein [Rhodospirillaceae bacterium]
MLMAVELTIQKVAMDLQFSLFLARSIRQLPGQIYENCYPRLIVSLALVFVDMVQRKKHEASKTLE